MKRMKKTYLNPTTDIIRVETQQMIAQSQLGVYSNDTEGISDNGQVLSRGGSSWDDEEDY